MNVSLPFDLTPYSLYLRVAIDIGGMTLLVFGMYYRRYRDKELATAASMFNVFAFAVLTVLSSVEFSISAGFGLFAILALFSLRSEQIGKIEITYFFGSIAIAVITSIQGTSIAFVAEVTLVVLFGAYLFDHPRILRSADSIKITLDKIDAHALSDHETMCAELSGRLGVDVMSYRISQLNYVNDLTCIQVFYNKPRK
ncbi:MAG: DUF4956 domain-containing protein [Pseudorhodobacter sp.]|nr:DUF4956 domain-containing protein [Pseudorhodobacter sp.]